MKHAHLGKRIACAALIVMMLAMTAAPALAASAKNPYGAYVVATEKASYLMLRTSPSGPVKARLPRGTVVVYRGQKNGWWNVSTARGEGYVDRRWLWSVDNSTSATYTPVDNLYVHTRANVEAPILGKLLVGKKVRIVNQSGTWAKISYKGHTGWVASKYLFRVK